jgi:DNA-binding FrmR family transcriptional regulator
MYAEKKRLQKRLRYIEGQLRGIEKMLEADRDADEVFAQLKAAEQSLHRAIYDVFETELKKQLAEILSKRLAECPGNCSDAERLQFTRREFDKLDLRAVIHSLRWLTNSSGDIHPVQRRKEVK